MNYFFDWGAFIMAVVNFLLTAVVLFTIIKLMNKFRDGMGGMKNKAELIASLTDAEKATCKNPLFPSRKELKAIVTARAEAEAAAKAEADAAEAAAAAEKETTEDILRDIRDLLQNK